MDDDYLKWKEDPFLRFIKSGSLGDGYGLLFIVNRFMVQNQLREVLNTMKRADDEGVVPKILCNKEAQKSLVGRVEDFYHDIQHLDCNVKSSPVLWCIYQSDKSQGFASKGYEKEVQGEIITWSVFIVSPPHTATTILHRTMTLDRECFRNFDLAYMLILLPETVAQWDEAGRKANAMEAQEQFEILSLLYPGALECLKTMHGIHVSEADEDLSWLDLGLGHPYRSLVKLYPEYRRKAQMLGKVEDDDTSNFDKYMAPSGKHRSCKVQICLVIYDNQNLPEC